MLLESGCIIVAFVCFVRVYGLFFRGFYSICSMRSQHISTHTHSLTHIRITSNFSLALEDDADDDDEMRWDECEYFVIVVDTSFSISFSFFCCFYCCLCIVGVGFCMFGLCMCVQCACARFFLIDLLPKAYMLFSYIEWKIRLTSFIRPRMLWNKLFSMLNVSATTDLTFIPWPKQHCNSGNSNSINNAH